MTEEEPVSETSYEDFKNEKYPINIFLQQQICDSQFREIGLGYSQPEA
jgi:hypothetical protein